MWSNLLAKSIRTSNHMCELANSELAWVKQGQFQNFQKSRGWFIPKIAQTKHVITGWSH